MRYVLVLTTLALTLAPAAADEAAREARRDARRQARFERMDARDPSTIATGPRGYRYPEAPPTQYTPGYPWLPNGFGVGQPGYGLRY